MERLIGHTTKLLSRNNCVTLSGMGAFLAHKVPASYNAKEQVFMPPHRELGFNPHITTDDALLLSEYVSAEGLSYDKAQKALSSDIASLHRKLEYKGVCCFGELGTFHMNINGDISFVPKENAIEDPEHYGFEPLSMPLLSRCEEKTIVIRQRDFSRYITIAAAVILAFFFVTPVSDSAYEKGMQASIAQISTAQTVVVEPVKESELYKILPVENTVTEKIYTEQENISNGITEDIPAIVEHTTEEVAEPISPQKVYSIIVASSPNADNAELAIKELTRKMEADYTVVVGSGRHRVSIGDYNSMNDAEEALSIIKKTFPDAWVLTH